MKTPPTLPNNIPSSSVWSSRVCTRVVVLLILVIVILMNDAFFSLLLGEKDTKSRLRDENSDGLRLGLAFLTENPIDESPRSDDISASSNHSSAVSSTQPENSTSTTEHKSSHTSATPSSTLPIVFESINITTLPPHVINHHIVNMNGRNRLGRGEKIILVGMPKSGTTTVGAFFKQSKRYSVCDFTCPLPVVNDPSSGNQTDGKTNDRKKFKRQSIGLCMASAKRLKLPLIKTCGDYDMYGQLDYPMPQNNRCQLPQITLLQDFHKEHPDATFILNLRNVSHWASSVRRWTDLRKRLPKCAFGPDNESPRSLKKWYYLHVQRIRHFVAMHPSHALVEIDVEHEDTGGRMAAIFGIKETYWVSFVQNQKERRMSRMLDSIKLPKCSHDVYCFVCSFSNNKRHASTGASECTSEKTDKR
jgi:Sulfotransferase domain